MILCPVVKFQDLLVDATLWEEVGQEAVDVGKEVESLTAIYKAVTVKLGLDNEQLLKDKKDLTEDIDDLQTDNKALKKSHIKDNILVGLIFSIAGFVFGFVM